MNSTLKHMKEILCELQKLQVKCFEKGLKFDITLLEQEPCEMINVTVKDHGAYVFYNFYRFMTKRKNEEELYKLRNLLNV